jgi:hypothetical protein
VWYLQSLLIVSHTQMLVDISRILSYGQGSSPMGYIARYRRKDNNPAAAAAVRAWDVFHTFLFLTFLDID